jgi:toxin-antitoxin system PIN domain toxin
MTSFDTNILFFAFAADRPEHQEAMSFLEGYSENRPVVICELVLIELYRLLRNAVMLKEPLSPAEAVGVVQAWRNHPAWQVAGFPRESQTVHDELWRFASHAGFATRRIFDARLALVLRAHGVTEFATANVKDFQGFGFKRVWNPLAA